MASYTFEQCATIEINHFYQNNIAIEDINGKDLSTSWGG